MKYLLKKQDVIVKVIVTFLKVYFLLKLKLKSDDSVFNESMQWNIFFITSDNLKYGWCHHSNNISLYWIFCVFLVHLCEETLLNIFHVHFVLQIYK